LLHKVNQTNFKTDFNNNPLGYAANGI